MQEGVSIQQGASFPPYVGVARVIVPYKKDRNKYIKECYRTRQVSLLMPSGTLAIKCNVTEEAIQNIKFPETYKELGSSIIFVTERVRQTPYVVAVLDNLSNRVNLDENSFHTSKSVGKNRIDVFGKGEGELYININAEKDALLKINITGEDSEAEINCDGRITITAADEVNLNSTKTIQQNYINNKGQKEVKLTISENGLKYEDLNGNTFEVQKNGKKINLFNGSEPLVKGNTLKAQLDQNNAYLTQLETSIRAFLLTLDSVVPGLSTGFTTGMTGATKGNYSNINSSKSFTD